MEFMDGICKTRECAWDVLLSESMKDQEATVEGAIHSIRNMGDVAFVILRKKEGLFQTVYENDKTNVSIHDLKEAMCVRLTGTLHEEERAPHGRELRISHVEILSSPAEPLPLAIDKWKLNTSHTEDRSQRRRGWCKPVQAELLPQTGRPGTEPAVLQTDDGRCF